MQKRLIAALVVLALALMFSGCSLTGMVLEKLTTTPAAQAPVVSETLAASPSTTPAAETTATTAAPEPVLHPVEEDVFFLSNGLEYSRLYSVRADGSDLTRILDEEVYSVFQQGERVYFIDDHSNLCYYHIPTGERIQLLDKTVMDYRVEGASIVYTTPQLQEDGTYTAFVNDLMHYDTATGDEFRLTTLEAANFAFGQGVVYYSPYDIESGITKLVGYNIAQREATVIAELENLPCNLFPVSGGIYYTEHDAADGVSHWYFASADGSSVTQLDDIIPASVTLLEVSGQGFLYMQSYGYLNEIPAGVSRMSSDGQITKLLEADDDNSFTAHQLPGGRWLFSSVEYVGWGDMNEYGGYDNYCPQYQYLLMDTDGTVRRLSLGDETAQLFRDGDFPLLDSSTARKPITAALYNLFVKNHGYEGQIPICSTTHGAWVNIADRKVDMALLAAPTEEEQAYLDQKGVEVEMKLYGGDGLVFIGNAANPVTDLTHEQILAIYRGEITNWNQLGGPDHPITVYFRDDQSGSQRLFENLVFKNEDLPDFAAMGFALMDDMSSIVNICLSDPYAIGYSIMTYLEDVYASEGLKVFSVNGASPSAETVRDKSYPYNTQGYLVIRSDEPADSPARRLFNWFGCAMSDDILFDNSVTPLHDDIVEPTPD